jgi:hypothetical protein
MEESANYKRLHVPFSRRGKKTHENRVVLKFILQRLCERITFAGLARASKIKSGNTSISTQLLSIARAVYDNDCKYFVQRDKDQARTILSYNVAKSHTMTVKCMTQVLELFVWTGNGLVNREVTGTPGKYWINRAHMRTLSTRSAKDQTIRDEVLKSCGWEECEVLSRCTVKGGMMYTVRMECDDKTMKIIQV